MAALGAEIRRRGYLAPASGAGLPERSSTFLAVLRLSTVLVLAFRALHLQAPDGEASRRDSNANHQQQQEDAPSAA
jgi:hypothetical protein